MELTNTNDENSFDPTPKLKSSPIPILFIPFNNCVDECDDCGNEYSKTDFLQQKYCENCFLKYTENATDTYLDVCIGSNFKKWRSNFSNFYTRKRQVLYFKQIVPSKFSFYEFEIVETKKNCKLCKKLTFSFQNESIFRHFKFRSCCCYQIFSGWIESSIIKKSIPILYLPWWDARDLCIVCKSRLESKSDCKKWCSNCFTIYTGCRYCLTTNIIFGITKQSQCKKCERISFINIDTKNNIIENFHVLTKINSSNHNRIANYVNNIDKNSNQFKIYDFINGLNYYFLPKPDWISSSQFENYLENNENSLQITFIPFNNNEDMCHYCKRIYSITYLYRQKYCKYCLFWYIKFTTNSNVNIFINTKNTQCTDHEPINQDFHRQSVQGWWCENCSEISYFEQIITYEYIRHNNDPISSISFEWTESTFIKKSIPILYLPWWDTRDLCIVCDQLLEFKSDCQKWCSNCFISYTGCRYCLTTNIIFGITKQSQCKECERTSFITIDTKNIIGKLLRIFTKINIFNQNQIADFMNNIDKISNQFEINDFIKNELNYYYFLPKPDWISHSQITNYLGNNENSLQIMFIPFNNNEDMCHYCKRIYSITHLYRQKYCKYCLFWYIKFTTNSNVNIFINTKNTQCTNHEPRNQDFHRQSIQEWCKNCSEISYFEQIITYEYIRHNNDPISSISFEWTESTFIKKSIPILYLPWWDTRDLCIVCDQLLESKSDCQKWCSNCFISYTGCRYCLTTNIIFGIMEQSQCKKCERILFITIDTKNIMENFHVLTKINSSNHNQIANYISNIDKNSNQFEIYDFINGLNYCFLPKPDWISYSQIENYLENNENSLTIPIMFISFNNNEDKCHYCKRVYSVTCLYEQKYCKHCLFWYIYFTANNNVEVCINTRSTQCINHEPRNIQNIQGWCKNCSEISYFEKIIIHSYHSISSTSIEWVESISTNKTIPILYLSFWDTRNICIVCDQSLDFISDCQKWCSNCFVICAGCRYCLTTNIIFGITKQSQCRECQRILFLNINITNIGSGNIIIEDFLLSTRINNNHYEIFNYINNIGKNSNPYYNPHLLNVVDCYKLIKDKLKLTTSFDQKVQWIPYYEIKDLVKIAEGGYGTVYKASWLSNFVAVKRFSNSQNIGKYFLNELKSLYQCYDSYIVRCFGITQDPKTKDYMSIMKYADGGDLHKHLNKNFRDIVWSAKLDILWSISTGLESIHEKNFIHRDLHSGNILSELFDEVMVLNQLWYIGDLGLSQPAYNTLNNEIYGVIPYIAPEIFNGNIFSKESDIYSMGMIMWELTTGRKPFDNVKHDTKLIYEIIDGKRPEITDDTPKCFADLMKRCWDSDPLKRPSITEFCKHINNISIEYDKQFIQAEKKRLELIKSKRLGPEFSEKPHSKAIFTSRSLSFFISKLSITSSSNTEQAKELYDDNEEYISKECELDIYNIQRPLNINSSRKRNIEELNIEAQNNGKQSKIEFQD